MPVSSMFRLLWFFLTSEQVCDKQGKHGWYLCVFRQENDCVSPQSKGKAKWQISSRETAAVDNLGELATGDNRQLSDAGHCRL